MPNADDTGVVNPNALLETIAGPPFDWDRVANPQAILEQVSSSALKLRSGERDVNDGVIDKWLLVTGVKELSSFLTSG